MSHPDRVSERSQRSAQRRGKPSTRVAGVSEPDGRRLASRMGNRAFHDAFVGGGVLPDGRAHPDVEATIARTRGSGSALDGAVRATFAPRLGDPLSDVRVHTDETADSLARSVSARAFATGSDLFFARGEYRPGSPAGNQLLAHELTHVTQQRGASTSGPLQVSQPGDATEREADRTARDIAG